MNICAQLQFSKSLRVRVIAALAVTSLLVTPTFAAPPVDPLNGATVGVGLASLKTRVEGLAKADATAGLVLGAQTGDRVALALAQAEVAYRRASKRHFEKLSVTDQQEVILLAGVAADFLSGPNSDLVDIEKRVHIAIEKLPFSAQTPVVFGISPSYSPVTTNTSLTFQLNGRFPDIDRRGFDAAIMMNGHMYNNDLKSKSRITFEITSKDFVSNSKLPVDNLLTVTVPVRKGFFPHKELVSFTSAIDSLPLLIGNFDLSITTTHQGPISRTMISSEDHQYSDDDDIICGGENGNRAIHTSLPTSDFDPISHQPRHWEVIPNSTLLLVDWFQGQQGIGEDWWYDHICSDSQKACVCLSTEHHGLGTSGKLDFRIGFTEQTLTTIPTTEVQHLTLGWREMKGIQLPVGSTWKAVFTRFDGAPVAFSGDYKDNFIEVTTEANGSAAYLNIVTAPFHDVDQTKMKAAVAAHMNVPNP